MRTEIAIAANLFVALALAACSVDSKKDTEPEPNIVPTNYKQEILDTLLKTLDDPTNVREALISDPELRTAGADPALYNLCALQLRTIFKRYYVGSQDRIAYFFAGHLNQLVESNAGAVRQRRLQAISGAGKALASPKNAHKAVRCRRIHYVKF